MQAKLNILICGKIRNVEDFNNELNRYLLWQSMGFVDRIVFSGWESDIDKNWEIIQLLREKGVEVILSKEPKFVIFGYIFHQIKSIYHGLSVFSDDDVVLKTRTDRVNTNFPPEMLLDRFHAAPSPAETSPFSKRLVVQYVTPFQPYFIGDQAFIGLKQDILKLISFDIWFAMEGAFLNPEQVLHSRPHIIRRPLFREFYKVNPGLLENKEKESGELYREMIQDQFYAGAIYTALKDVLDSYVLGFSDEDWNIAEWPADGSLACLTDSKQTSLFDKIRYFPLAAMIDTSSATAIRRMMAIPILRGGTETMRDLAEKGAWSSGGVDALPRPDLHPDAEGLARKISNIVPHTRTPGLPLRGHLLRIYYGGDDMIKAAT